MNEKNLDSLFFIIPKFPKIPVGGKSGKSGKSGKNYLKIGEFEDLRIRRWVIVYYE